ncbi:glucose-6-phosphate isomerase [Bizionia paragorgiae]|uniref:glucose-6-phosphate isomerase n=1 Tax=Bizionia paragorgiae TaxID=283786 RepID=UPI0009317471
MFPKTSPILTQSWKKLKAHFLTNSSVHMNDLFEQDPKRFEKFSIDFEDLLFDYSKNRITEETIALLVELANECQLDKAIRALFEGEKINETEDRAVLHTALRTFSDEEIVVDNENITPLVLNERKRVKELCEQIHSGTWTGYSGKKIKNVVNIGVGGSDLGVVMVTEALKPYWEKGITPFFISNVDSANLLEVLEQINFEETLFIISSKTFTTLETSTNAESIKALFLEECKDDTFVHKHFIAVTGNKIAANEFGIPNENVFEIWDWVCGRFSLWGSIGMSIALTVGYENYEQLLKGANAADQHFKNEAFDKNIPILMGLLSIWYINFFNAQSEVVLPYAHNMSKFVAYLQQAAMESNGKNKDRNGNPIDYTTGVVVWGGAGTNGQHSFHQLLHQGMLFIPCDFIVPVNSKNKQADHQEKLLSNALAQPEALKKGRTLEEVEEIHEKTNQQINSFKVFEGNKPSNTILIKELNPYNLGSLLAFYEHKVFVQGVIWNIFSFDQWGVELGKELSTSKLKAIQKRKVEEKFDASTEGLLERVKTVSYLQ